MAILQHHWRLDEGSGLFCADSGAANHRQTFNMVPGNDYPQWAVDSVDGAPCMRFDGAAVHGLSYPCSAVPVSSLYTIDAADAECGNICVADGSGISFAIRFKFTDATVGRSIFALTGHQLGPWTPYLYGAGRPAVALFHTPASNGARIGFGIHVQSYLSVMQHTILSTVTGLNDGEWHTALATTNLVASEFSAVAGGPYNGQVSLYLDGELQGQAYIGPGWFFLPDSTWEPERWVLGGGTIANCQAISAFDGMESSPWDRRFLGDLRDAQVWCGVPLPTYAEVVEANRVTRYIGHCPNINDGNICVPRSNSRCRTGQSSSAVIVRTS